MLFDEDIAHDATQKQLLDFIPTLIYPHYNALFTAHILVKELERAIFQMKSFGALGPNGFHSRFYQHFWDLLKYNVMGIIKESFSSK